MTDKAQIPPKTPSKTAREEALQKALRDNLKRRKAAAKEGPSPAVPELHEKASGNEESGA